MDDRHENTHSNRSTTGVESEGTTNAFEKKNIQNNIAAAEFLAGAQKGVKVGDSKLLRDMDCIVAWS